MKSKMMKLYSISMSDKILKNTNVKKFNLRQITLSRTLNKLMKMIIEILKIEIKLKKMGFGHADFKSPLS